MLPPDPATVNAVSSGVEATGRVFASGGIDGLILFALVLGTFLFAAALGWALWMLRAANRECSGQSKAFADAGHVQAEANKELATAVASMASSDMTFKQAMAATIVDLRHRLEEIEAAEKHRTQP